MDFFHTLDLEKKSFQRQGASSSDHQPLPLNPNGGHRKPWTPTFRLGFFVCFFSLHSHLCTCISVRKWQKLSAESSPHVCDLLSNQCSNLFAFFDLSHFTELSIFKQLCVWLGAKTISIVMIMMTLMRVIMKMVIIIVVVPGSGTQIPASLWKKENTVSLVSPLKKKKEKLSHSYIHFHCHTTVIRNDRFITKWSARPM